MVLFRLDGVGVGTRQRREDWEMRLGLDKGDGVVPFVREETREDGNERRCDCLCEMRREKM
ncbi:hypothetical protein F2Q69_00044565 [Brassica cretica]|uniref:Uncharacterized protein n=1 Tax=Brassica cretica TaxID=69181 RepID=A0A8S9NDL5_BRACR|nr:hypothetical protein F2Q69_00044565 [Brassica cretica]